MATGTFSLGLTLNDIPALIGAIGALGIAAMGTVEAAFKALLVYDPPAARISGRPIGLPYAGYAKISRLLKRVGDAMEISYGAHYGALIAAQYRANRGASQAPDTIRQGVRLGLPYLSKEKAVGVVRAVWGLSEAHSAAFVDAILVPPTVAPANSSQNGAKSTAESTAGDAQATPSTSAASLPAAGLAGRFSTALDSTVQAAFDGAEEDYQSWVRFWAGLVALVLSLLYHLASVSAGAGCTPTDGACRAQASAWTGWVFAIVVGLAAVPLAPIAKDLSSSLSQALTALRQANAKAGA